MAVIVLDSGILTAFADADRQLRRRIDQFSRSSRQPFLVPATVIIEATTATRRDANVNRFLKACEIVILGEAIARRSAALRHASRRGSAIDASVIATAELRGGGYVLTGDLADLRALADGADGVEVLGLHDI